MNLKFDEPLALLGCYAALIDNWLPKFREKLISPKFKDIAVQEEVPPCASFLKLQIPAFIFSTHILYQGRKTAEKSSKFAFVLISNKAATKKRENITKKLNQGR